jgi:hypothetical protein
MSGEPAASPSRSMRWIPCGIFFAVLLIVALTARDYGVTWDEPAYFHASDLHVQWLAEFFADALHRQIDRSLDDKQIEAAWHWDPYHVPHPPFSRIVSGLTEAASAPLLGKIVGYRLGPALFFALLATVMYLWMSEIFGRAAGLFSVACLLLTPNLFAFAHIAVTDLPLASLWFATAYCFWKGLDNCKWSIALGIVWGLALSTKFPAFLTAAPLIVWAQIYFRRRYTDNLFCMIFIAPAIMVATQPYLWHQTALRILQFFYEGLSRGYRTDASFPIYFFHRMFLTSDLPLYYPFFLTAVTTPETILCLALAGILATMRNKPERPVLALFLINAVFILVLGLLPGAVLHDGMRQILSIYPFLVALATAGFCSLVEFLSARARRLAALEAIGNLKAKLASALAVLLLSPAAIDLGLYHPFELSYYNRLVGGIRGAYDRGLELTYFMEAITPEFLGYLNRTLPPNAVVNGLFANFMLEYYQKEGLLRRDIRITSEEKFDYAVVLNRRSSVNSLPSRQVEFMKEKPQASVSLAGIPLVMLYRTARE